MGLKMAVPNSLARPGVCTSLTRPVNPFEGQVIYETDTNDTLVWTGSAWLNLHFASFDAKGNIFAGTGSSTGTNLAVGANNTVLSANSATATGLAWTDSLTLASVNVSGSLSASEITGAFTGQVTIDVQNGSGATIAKGAPLFITGTTGLGIPIVDNVSSPSMSERPVIGLAGSAILNGAEGQCVIFGVISGLNTSAYSVNAQLYVNDNGTLVDDQPVLPGEVILPIGRCVRSHATLGEILATCMTPVVIAPNTIDITGSVIADQSVQANSATFTTTLQAATVTSTSQLNAVNVDISGSLEISGVRIDPTGANIDEVLVYDGTKFAPANIDTGGKSFAYFMGA